LTSCCFLHGTLLTRALASCDLGAGEPLEKTDVEPFKNANLLFKTRQIAKAQIILCYFYFLTEKRNHG